MEMVLRPNFWAVGLSGALPELSALGHLQGGAEKKGCQCHHCMDT